MDALSEQSWLRARSQITARLSVGAGRVGTAAMRLGGRRESRSTPRAPRRRRSFHAPPASLGPPKAASCARAQGAPNDPPAIKKRTTPASVFVLQALAVGFDQLDAAQAA